MAKKEVEERVVTLVNKAHAASTKLVKACKAVAQAIRKDGWPDKGAARIWEKAAQKVAAIVGTDA